MRASFTVMVKDVFFIMKFLPESTCLFENDVLEYLSVTNNCARHENKLQ